MDFFVVRIAVLLFCATGAVASIFSSSGEGPYNYDYNYYSKSYYSNYDKEDDFLVDDSGAANDYYYYSSYYSNHDKESFPPHLFAIVGVDSGGALRRSESSVGGRSDSNVKYAPQNPNPRGPRAWQPDFQ